MKDNQVAAVTKDTMYALELEGPIAEWDYSDPAENDGVWFSVVTRKILAGNRGDVIATVNGGTREQCLIRVHIFCENGKLYDVMGAAFGAIQNFANGKPVVTKTTVKESK